MNNNKKIEEKPKFGIAVDGWCKGNPGPGGYKGVDLETGKILFSQQHLGVCTNNIAEFIAIVHGLMYIKKHGKHHVVYSDSEIAIGMVKNKLCSTTMFTGDKPELATKIWRCEMFLVEMKREPSLKKWITKKWGEIPADPGHK